MESKVMKISSFQMHIQVRFAVLLFCLLLQGCSAAVEIKNAEISDYDPERVVLTVKTDKNLDSFADSYYAYTVMLMYCVNISNISENDEHSSLIEKFPFSARRLAFDAQLADRDGNFISKWIVPVYGEVNISGREYSYNLGSSDSNFITMILYGATMGGGHLKSSPYQLNLTDKTN